MKRTSSLLRSFGLVLVIGLVALCPTMAAAVDLEPIPEGADLVLFVNNHSNLPLGNILTAAPIPAMAKQHIDAFLGATGFNPLKDITRVQAMVKKGATKSEDHAVIVLTGTFDQAKITEFIKGKIGQAIDEEKLGAMTVMKSKDGKGGLCFIDATHAAFGTLPAVKTFVEAKGGSGVSKDYDELKAMVGDKAYVALLIGGKEFLKGEMDKNRAKRQARMEQRQRNNPVGKWLDEYLSEGVEPKGIFAQILDSKIEAKVSYARGDAKANFIGATLEISDPKLTIEKMFNEFLKVLPEMPAPQGPQGGSEGPRPSGPSRW